VYGFYGGNDERVNATIAQSTELMKRAGKQYDPVIYAGAGHGFMRAGEAPDASDANRNACREAWQRLKELLKKI
jgi:carboxymethylenebutenolidase